MAFNWRKFPWTNLHDLNLDWIIQTVKTLEENLTDALALVQTTVDTAITKLLTGSGDLTINKTGDVNISGAHVNLSNTYISAGSEQLTLLNPDSNTSMTANYNKGALTLSNNQDSAAGVTLYPINTPTIISGDDSTFAANVGYVKNAVATVDEKLDTEISNRTSGDTALLSEINRVDGKLDTEIGNRTSGDAALQSTIDNVIMPRLDSISAASNSYVLLVTRTSSTENEILLTPEQITDLQAAAQNNYPITLIVREGESYTAAYPFLVESTSMLFTSVCNFNSINGSINVNQALGRILVASVNLAEGANKLSFLEFPSGLTPFLPLSLSIIWTGEANSYTLTDNEYAILRQSLLDKRPIFIVRNTASAGGEQTIYMLQTCATPSILNVDSMTLILKGPSNSSIKVQMASKTIVPNIQ